MPSLHRLDSTIPLAVDMVVRKATAKRREDRYTSADEAATLTPEQAQSLVRRYYCYWNEGDYHLAYNLLGAVYRNQYPWQDPDGPPAFRYSDTIRSDVTEGNVDTSSDGTFQVQITDKATETNGTNTYTGYFIVGKDKDGTWRLLEPHLSVPHS